MFFANWISGSFRHLGKLVLVFGLAALLAGCGQYTNMANNYFGMNAKERQQAIDTFFVRNEQVGNLAMNVTYFMGPLALYMPLDEYRGLVTDEDSLLRYVFGLYFAYDVSLTYEQFAAETSSDVTEAISENDFYYYRLMGKIFLEEIKARPENRGIDDRLALFGKRSGISGRLLFNLYGPELNRLIKDDDALTTFLTDDEVATAWIKRYTLDPAFVHYELDAIGVPSLGPLSDGTTPGTGS